VARNRRGFPIRRAANVAVAVPAFSPSDISGLVLWLDADAIDGLNDGDPVTTWEDQSSEGNDATQATGSAKPTYQTNELNGKPIVRFDGTDDALDGARPVSSTGTMFIVAKQASAVSSTTKTLVSLDDGLHSQIFTDSDSHASAWNYYADNADGIIANIGGAAADWSIIVVKWSDNANIAFYVDGATGPADDPFNDSITAADVYRLGLDHDDSTPGDFDVAEMLIYDTALSDGDREDVEDYLTTKYDL
jgi:hypothetical protein